MSLSRDELERFVNGLADDPARWRRFVRHAGESRVYEQVWEDEDVNAWLICWSEDQDTGFHDHDASAAAIVVIEGQIREDRLRLEAGPGSSLVGAGETLFVSPTTIHRVLHAGEVPAVTLHAYSPPLRRTGAYRIGPDGELERAAQSYEEELRGDPAFA